MAYYLLGPGIRTGDVRGAAARKGGMRMSPSALSLRPALTERSELFMTEKRAVCCGRVRGRFRYDN